jgi:hypothetical protein
MSNLYQELAHLPARHDHGTAFCQGLSRVGRDPLHSRGRPTPAVTRQRDGTIGSPRPMGHLVGLREHHGVAGTGSSSGALAAAGVAFDDELVAGGGEAVDG